MLFPLLLLIVGLLALLVGVAMCAAHWMEPIPSSSVDWWFWTAVIGLVCTVGAIVWFLILLFQWWLA